MLTPMISGALESAICVAIWVVLLITSVSAGALVIQWLSENPDHAATKNKLTQTKKKWFDDKKRLLAESKAIFDREAYLIERLQREEDEMAEGLIDPAGLELMSVLKENMDEHRFKIRHNWRQLSDLLDRYCD